MSRRGAVRFKTQRCPFWLHRWDPAYLQVVARRAEVLWIWSPGVLSSQTLLEWHPDLPHVLAMERLVRRLVPGRAHAIAVMQPTKFRARRGFVAVPPGDAGCNAGHWMAAAQKLSAWMFSLRNLLPGHLEYGVIAEDFVSRAWYKTPTDYLLLDTPILGPPDLARAEVRTWLDRPGAIRRGRHSRMTPSRWLSTWSVKFEMQDAAWSHLPAPRFDVGRWGLSRYESTSGWVPSLLHFIEQ